MRTDEVLHVRFRFQEFPDAPVEIHESWIDWEREQARQEAARLGSPTTLRAVVTGGRTYERGTSSSFPVASFERGALSQGIHLFHTLTASNATFLEPLRREERTTDGIERYSWTVELRDNEGSFCGAISLEVNAATSRPIRSFAESCPGREPGRGFITEYEVFEVVDRDTLPPDHFDPAAVAR